MQFFERTLDDSANRRLVIPESFLATDAILDSHGERRRAASRCIRRAFVGVSQDELPFMATEELIVRAVRAGGDRQVAHERIRQHSIEAARALKNGATRNDMLERLSADPAFGVSFADLESALDPIAVRRPRAGAGRRVSRRSRSGRCSPGTDASRPVAGEEVRV